MNKTLTKKQAIMLYKAGMSASVIAQKLKIKKPDTVREWYFAHLKEVMSKK